MCAICKRFEFGINFIVIKISSTVHAQKAHDLKQIIKCFVIFHLHFVNNKKEDKCFVFE